MPNRELDPSGEEVAYDVQRLLREAEPLLAALEGLGSTSFDIAAEMYSINRGLPLRDAYEGLLALGVSTGLSSDPPDASGGRIFLAMPYSSTGYGETLRVIVLREASDDGNRDKLREPDDAPARHLCVLIDPPVGRAFFGLRDGNPGEAPDELPEPITTAWALAGTRAAAVTPPGGWVVHEIADPDVFDHPERWEHDRC